MRQSKGIITASILLITAAIGTSVFLGYNYYTKNNIAKEQPTNSDDSDIEVLAAIESQNNQAFELVYNEKNALSINNASIISSLQSQENEIKIKKSKEQENTKNNANNNQTNTSTFGQFQASAYGYSGQDKISYWKGINPDVFAYLRIPGTNISHPVVQNTSDINYYLHRNIYGQYDTMGVLWTNTDTRSGGTSSDMSDNTVIYGHNWTNYSAQPAITRASDKMFGQLTSFHYENMCRSYPYFYYSTPFEEMTFKIFAVFYTELAFDYIRTDGNNDAIISEALRRSRHNFNVDVNGTDKIITLSTCTRAYGKTENQRFVVMGRLLRPGEKIEPVEVNYNPNHQQPNVWG